MLVVIPARGGSKGIPRKNLRPLNGKPLIYYAIKNGLSIKCNNLSCYVSSEDDEILMLAKKFGASIIKRSKSNADDSTTLDPVIFEAYTKIKQLEGIDYDLVITLQPTSPLLTTKSIENGIEELISKKIDTIISGKWDSHLTWIKSNGSFSPNYKKRVNRQELPEIYKETGGFVITKSNFVTETSRFGKSIGIFPLSKKEAIDIDDFEDWNLCEYYLRRKNILFIVAGNSTIGMGHVYNTLSIANEILNHNIGFFVDRGSKLAYKKIKETNYSVDLIEEGNLISALADHEPDIVVNDRLDTEAEEIQQMKDAGYKVINFEDVGGGADRADLVINAMYPEGKLVKDHYFGAKYFILRDEFIFTPNIKIRKEVNNILLAFGGVDPNNFTERILGLLLPIIGNAKITVVAGLGYNHVEEIKARHPQIIVKQDVKSISDEMSKADMVFTSAGRTTFEVASLGIPAIVLCQNKRETTHFFASEKNGFYNLGLGVNVEDREILNAYKSVLNYETRILMHDRMISHELKNGKKRVLKLINKVIDE
ncbi:acylneuraminate cytidylyltransferase [Muricauda sp. TY007]|nr:acylneuraminate cytidylyltransferase [Muricauda sp. TY007]